MKFTSKHPMQTLLNHLNRPLVLSTGRIMFRGKMFGQKEIAEIREWLKQLTFADIDLDIDEETDVDCLLTAYREIGKDIKELYYLATESTITC